MELDTHGPKQVHAERPSPAAPWSEIDAPCAGDMNSDGGAIVAIDDSTFGFLKLEPFLDPGDPSDPADLNGDGCVDAADVGLLLVAWNAPGGDINGDGNTDAADLGLLVAAWSPCTG